MRNKMYKVAFLVFLQLAGCQEFRKAGIETGGYVLSQVPSVLSTLISEVQSSAQGSFTDWSRTLNKLETVGIQTAVVAIESVLKNVLSSRPAVNPIKYAVMIDRLNVARSNFRQRTQTSTDVGR